MVQVLVLNWLGSGSLHGGSGVRVGVAVVGVSVTVDGLSVVSMAVLSGSVVAL